MTISVFWKIILALKSMTNGRARNYRSKFVGCHYSSQKKRKGELNEGDDGEHGSILKDYQTY